MALIECGECGKRISDKAAACPACGAPTGSNGGAAVSVTRAGGKWEGWGFVMIVGGMLAVMASDPLVSTMGVLAMLAGLVVFIIGRLK